MEFTQRHHTAAQLLAEDELTHVQIAERVGVVERTIYEWKSDPDFRALLQEKIERFAERTLKKGIARRENRLHYLRLLHEKTMQVIDERGAAEENTTVPGGKTGLVCRTIKSVNGRDVEEFKYDDAIVKTVVSLQDAAAEELGQKIRKFEHSGPDGGPIVVSDAKSKLLSKLASGSSPEPAGSGEDSTDIEPQ